MSARRILVTGATGFLGGHLLRAMESEPAQWTALTAPGRVENAGQWERDLENAEIDGIVHLAAAVRHSRDDAADVFRTNVDGTVAMVRLAARLRCRVIYLSTSGTVGCFSSGADRADENAPYCEARVARWPYYASKIAAERAACAVADELGVELVMLRPPVMLGPDDHGGRSTSTVKRVLDERVPVLFDGGMHFVDVRDVASAILAALRVDRPRRVYHLAGTESSLPDFFRRVASLAGLSLNAPSVPAAALRVAARMNWRLGRFRSSVLPDPVLAEMATSYWGLRSTFAERELGFAPRPGDATLNDTIAWLRSAS